MELTSIFNWASPEVQQAIANIILLVITGAVGAISKAVYTRIKTSTSAQQFAILEQVAASAVSAAEQGAIAGFVTDRKATAMAIVAEGLKNAGITNLTAEQISAAIEAAVKDTLNHNKQATSVPGVTVEVNVTPDVLEGDQPAG